MKSNISMSSGVVKSGEFTYTRKPRTLKAYGKEFEIPVKTVDFADKLDEITSNIAKTAMSSDTVKEIRKGIALFIGEEETENIFPAEKLGDIDIDEIIGFWTALKFEQNKTGKELLARYQPVRK